MKHFSVAYTLREKTLGRCQRNSVGAPQHPPSVFLSVVGEALAGVPQHLGQQLGERHVLGQRDIDAAMRSADRDPGKPDAHDSFPSMEGRLRNGPHFTYHGRVAMSG
jgi:hypothetical protein